MQKRTRNILIAGAVAIAVLLGSGLATYLLGDAAQETSGIPRVDPEKKPLQRYESTEMLRLKWGNGPRDVWVDDDFFGCTLDTFSVDDEGRVLIADHPEWHIGARVRRFSPMGDWSVPG